MNNLKQFLEPPSECFVNKRTKAVAMFDLWYGNSSKYFFIDSCHPFALYFPILGSNTGWNKRKIINSRQ